MINVPTNLNNLKTKVGDLDVGKKNYSCWLKTLEWCSK